MFAAAGGYLLSDAITRSGLLRQREQSTDGGLGVLAWSACRLSLREPDKLFESGGDVLDAGEAEFAKFVFEFLGFRAAADG